MKIWHQKLIRHLPWKLLAKLHADCCDLRASGWNTFRREIKYVFDGGRIMFSVYHIAVMDELISRLSPGDMGYYRFALWRIHNYRGPSLGFDPPDDRKFCEIKLECDARGFVYREHDDAFLLEDVGRLIAGKHRLVNGISEEEIMLRLAVKGIFMKEGRRIRGNMSAEPHW